MSEVRLRPACSAAFAALAVLAAFPISSANAGNLDSEGVKELSPITINRAKNPGDVPYVYFRNSQALLQSLLPAEPHVIEMRYRLFFTGQQKIPWYRIDLRDERIARFDGLKACFHPGEGRIEIDGTPALTTSQGSCQVLRFDPVLATAGAATIAFIGALDTVTLHEVDT